MVTLYFLIAIIFCIYTSAVTGLSEEMEELIQMLHTTCVGETGVAEDTITKVNTDKVLPDDEKLKCYIKCLMAEMACISDDGIIDIEATIAVMPENVRGELEPVIRKCGTIIGANPCDNAWLTTKCYLEAKPETFMLI